GVTAPPTCKFPTDLFILGHWLTASHEQIARQPGELVMAVGYASAKPRKRNHTMSKSDRIWYQSFVDPQSQRPYMTRLQDRLTQIASPQMSVEVHGISPPDRFLSPVTEFRCAAHAIRNAIRAEQTGCSAYVIGHFQEPGLLESRCAVDIPVVGLVEAAMLYACTLGRTFGLVTINPCFIPWHRDQIARLGLGQRAVGVRAVNTEVATYMEAFEVETAYQRVKQQFAAEANALAEAGA